MDMKSAVFVACSIVLLFVVETASAKEFFAAVSGLEVLLETTKQIIASVNEYLSSQQEILERITRVKEEYERFHERALIDKQTFLENSFNQYLLIKRLTVDWKNFRHLIINSTITGREIVQELVSRADLEWPDDEDLSEVKQAVIRLQEIYGLNTTDIVKGVALNSNSSFAFNADDCEEIGDWAYGNEFFETAFPWLREALLRKNDDNHMLRNNVNEIIKNMLYSAYMTENQTESLLMAAELADLEHSEEKRKKKGEIIERRRIFENTNLLCRGHQLRDPSKETSLRCLQQVSGHPYLLLQLIKEEELNLDPRIVIYHDILSDSEMEIIKELAKHELDVSFVGDGGHRLGSISVRVSKTAWLKDDVHKVLLRLNRRISDITGLTTDTAEPLQVANYGTGGHYFPHYDYPYNGSEPDNRMRKSNQRIATWLNYMSDVQEGGATVFPLIGIRVQPEKGSALFWYNLRKSGNGDSTTLHSACPVLAGSKWAANKWFRENGQEFRRRCSLDPSE